MTEECALKEKFFPLLPWVTIQIACLYTLYAKKSDIPAYQQAKPTLIMLFSPCTVKRFKWPGKNNCISSHSSNMQTIIHGINKKFHARSYTGYLVTRDAGRHKEQYSSSNLWFTKPVRLGYSNIIQQNKEKHLFLLILKSCWQHSQWKDTPSPLNKRNHSNHIKIG